MPDRYTDHDAYIPHTFEFVLKTVEYGRIRCHIVSDEGYGRQELRTGDVHFLLVDLSGEFQAAYFRARGIYIIYIDTAVVCRNKG